MLSVFRRTAALITTMIVTLVWLPQTIGQAKAQRQVEKPPPAPELVRQSGHSRVIKARLLASVRDKGVKRIGEIIALKDKYVFIGEFGELEFWRPSGRPTQKGDLWVANRDFTGLERLTENGRNFHPAASPDGSKVAFIEEAGIKIINVYTKEVSFISGLSSRNEFFDWPKWSPSGKAIAVIASDNDRYWVRAAAEPYGAIYDSQPVNPNSARTSFSWSRDNELIVRGQGKFVFDWERLLADRREPEPTKDATSETSDSDPKLSQLLDRVKAAGVKRISRYVPSPSGNRIAFVGEFEELWSFVSIQVGRPKTDIWLINRDGSGLRRLTRGGFSYDPAWSPDEREIAFVREGSVRILNPDTGRARNLRALQGYRKPEGECTYHEFSDPQWSPNGKALTALASNGCHDGWVIAADPRFSNKLFEYDTNQYSWNSESELVVEDRGKQVFDWSGARFKLRAR
jgi:hypothetical protein